MRYNYNEWLKNPHKIFCKCNCGAEIIIQLHHKYSNIPEYIKGHYWNNKKRNEDTKQKIRESKLGTIVSEETKEKISNTLTGHFTSEETKEKIRKTELGKIVSEETKQKMRKPKSEYHKQNISNTLKGNIPWNKGIINIYSDVTLDKMSKVHINKRSLFYTLDQMVNNDYCYLWTEKLRIKIRTRDNFICAECGKVQENRKFSVHHIHYKKEDCYPDLITLCTSCHSKANFNRDYWENRFMNKINDLEFLFWLQYNKD